MPMITLKKLVKNLDSKTIRFNN